MNMDSLFLHSVLLYSYSVKGVGIEMKVSELTEKIEADLIARICHEDDDALQELCYYYRPMINAVEKNYFLRHYDHQDWEQDAMIVCYKSAIVYSRKRGKFGSYFKKRLNNHARTLVRYDLAYRRRAFKESISLEALIENNTECIEQPTGCCLEVPISETYTEFLNSLSALETSALLTILGEADQEKIVKRLKIDRMALLRARSRVLQKLRKVLFN